MIKIDQSHSGKGDNIGRDKIINVYQSYTPVYESLKERISDLQEDLQLLPIGDSPLRRKKLNNLEKLQDEYKQFKSEVARVFSTLSQEDKTIFSHTFDGIEVYETDKFFTAVQRVQNEEANLSSSSRKSRREHFDNWLRYMESLSPNELFAQQRRDSLFYLKAFGLEVKDLKEQLHRLGYFEGGVNNEFDKDLVEALMNFKGDNEMRHIDGMFGELTFQRIGSKLRELENK